MATITRSKKEGTKPAPWGSGFMPFGTCLPELAGSLACAGEYSLAAHFAQAEAGATEQHAEQAGQRRGIPEASSDGGGPVSDSIYALARGPKRLAPIASGRASGTSSGGASAGQGADTGGDGRKKRRFLFPCIIALSSR